MHAVLKFLGMRDMTEAEAARVLGVRRANAQSARYPRMWPKTRALLAAFYRPFNERLAELMGGDSRWAGRREKGVMREPSGGAQWPRRAIWPTNRAASRSAGLDRRTNPGLRRGNAPRTTRAERRRGRSEDGAALGS